jgi:hypothetical protein
LGHILRNSTGNPCQSSIKRMAPRNFRLTTV